MYRFDVALTQGVNSLAGHSALLDFLMIAISAIGVPALVILVALQWWRKADRSHLRHTLVACGLSFLLGLAFNQAILLVVYRVRPYDAGITNLLIARSSDPSFPSDHATASIAIAAAFLLHGMRRTSLWLFIGAALVMVSRVYIGIHYASDVLGGAVTGFVAALVVLLVYREGTRLDRTITSIF